MAGDVGSRFWPLSCSEKSKQYFIPSENFVVVTGEMYRSLVKAQLPMLADEQILTEPCRRNTAPCIGILWK